MQNLRQFAVCCQAETRTASKANDEPQHSSKNSNAWTPVGTLAAFNQAPPQSGPYNSALMRNTQCKLFIASNQKLVPPEEPGPADLCSTSQSRQTQRHGAAAPGFLHHGYGNYPAQQLLQRSCCCCCYQHQHQQQWQSL